MSSHNTKIQAYQIADEPDMSIGPCPIEREWMDLSDRRQGYRCLPLVMANQSGWVISNPADFTLLWNGGDDPSNLKIDFGAHAPHPRVLTHFGHGIFTFRIPWLFRTPPGINLMVKGASNWLKDGAQALEAIVETDWATATFTMNWKTTRINEPVRFEKGEPICMIVPIPRGLAASLQPALAPISANPELENEYLIWRNSRMQRLEDIKDEPGIAPKDWQKHYYKGQTRSGKSFPEHETELDLKEFVPE
jgi:hypothetical protein